MPTPEDFIVVTHKEFRLTIRRGPSQFQGKDSKPGAVGFERKTWDKLGQAAWVEVEYINNPTLRAFRDQMLAEAIRRMAKALTYVPAITVDLDQDFWAQDAEAVRLAHPPGAGRSDTTTLKFSDSPEEIEAGALPLYQPYHGERVDYIEVSVAHDSAIIHDIVEGEKFWAWYCEVLPSRLNKQGDDHIILRTRPNPNDIPF